MKKWWQIGAKVTNDKQLVAVVIATSIRDGKQYCRLRVAVENQLTGKIIVADQARMVRGDSLRARHTVVSELGEKEAML
jgi:hypothetical protein